MNSDTVLNGAAILAKTVIEAVIRDAALRYDQDPNTLLAIATIESGLNPKAKNPASSASGLFQFLARTARFYDLDDPFDPVANADAGARLTRDNARTLGKALKRPATPGELYLAHQQGAGGAINLLRSPQSLARNVVGIEAVRLNGGKEDWTCQQLADLWINKLDAVLAKIKGE